MDWHIITSSKGGVGKTLISLMLLAYCLTKRQVLLIDLNGVNADLKKLVGSPQTRGTGDYFRLPLERRGELIFRKIEQDPNCVVGWLFNPFHTYTSDNFFEVLSTLKKNLPKISNHFANFMPAAVIMDTNYHFCNIFSDRDKDYEIPFFQEEEVFIWFIWVYKQVRSLLLAQNAERDDPFYAEIPLMLQTADVIEEYVKNTKMGNPFIHVINPISMALTPEETLFKSASKEFQLRMRGFQSIDSLEKLAKLRGGGSVKFRGDLVVRLQSGQTQVATDGGPEVNVQVFFAKVLEDLATTMVERPRNLIPIFTYQKELVSYTDFERILLPGLRGLEVYKHFVELCRPIVCV